MKKLSRDKAFKIWQNFFDNLEEEFFKVETLQHYLGENEDIPGLKDYLNGNHESAKQKLQKYAANQELHDSLITESKKQSKAGIQSIRIRITEKPLHPYLKFEIEHYKQVNIPLGKKEVFIVDRADIDDSTFELGDFMIFDRNRVADSSYSEDGRLVGMDIYEPEDNIEKFLNTRKLYMNIATPLSEFMDNPQI